MEPDTTTTAPITAGPALVDLPARTVLSVDGRGAPEDPAFGIAIRASLAALYAFVAELGLGATGPHTEIYLDDPASTPPAELRTVLQVPVGPGRRRS